MNAFWQQLSKCDPAGEARVVTVLEGPTLGEKALLAPGAPAWYSLPGGFLMGQGAALAGLPTGGSTLNGVRVFCDSLGGEKQLVVCGGGHVALPVLQLGRILGMETVCIDDRPEFAEQSGADRILCEDFTAALQKIPGSRDTFFVVVTRGHIHDADCLLAICQKPHAYIGMIGSRRHGAAVKERLTRGGVPQAVQDDICTPIGLDIGAETPAEIAVAILAEIIEVKNRRARNFGYPKAILHEITAPDAPPLALASVVYRQGSAPRGEGAKMLVQVDGSIVGSIGGGGLEHEVILRAQNQLKNGTAAQMYRSTLTEGDALREGMACGGTVEVMLELI